MNPLHAMHATPACLTDAEVDAICDGLVQNAAKLRYLRRMGLPVERKPNGRPLVRRADWERGTAPTTRPNVAPKWITA